MKCVALRTSPSTAVPKPSQLRQRSVAVLAVELDLPGIGIAEAIGRLALAFELWEVRALGKEVLERAIKVEKRLVYRMARCIGKPRRLRAVAPLGEALLHRELADEFAARRVVFLLQRQPLVIDEPAGACELTHLARLFAGRHEFESKGLETLHKIMVPAAFTLARTATPSALTFVPLKGRKVSALAQRAAPVQLSTAALTFGQ